jgi:hypothetical protein
VLVPSLGWPVLAVLVPSTGGASSVPQPAATPRLAAIAHATPGRPHPRLVLTPCTAAIIHGLMHLSPGFFLRGRASGLLGLALAAACSDDGFTNQSSGQAEASTTGTPNTATAGDEGPLGETLADADTAPSPGTTQGDVDSSTGPIGPETITGTGTEAATDTGTGTATDGTTGGGGQACAEGCAVEFACGMEWASEEECVAWCEANLVKAAAFSPFCADAWEAVSACLGTLTCEEFSQWQSPMMFPYPCSDADVALSVECKGQ